jgi:hypothetical protein
MPAKAPVNAGEKGEFGGFLVSSAVLEGSLRFPGFICNTENLSAFFKTAAAISNSYPAQLLLHWRRPIACAFLRQAN